MARGWPGVSDSEGSDKGETMDMETKVRLGRLWVAVVTLMASMSLMVTAGEAADVQASAAAERVSPLLALDAIAIDPSNPGPTTLCKLRVKIRNMGSQAATSFLFGVRINGQELTVYKDHVYFQTIMPGTVGEVQLYNFWVTEPGHPIRKDGQLRVEVTLKEAQWVEVRTKGNVNEYKRLGDVADLPIALSVARPLVTSQGR